MLFSADRLFFKTPTMDLELRGAINIAYQFKNVN
jgi:hypothetical protein